MGLYEGNYFYNVAVPVADGFDGHLYSTESGTESQCDADLGRDCVDNLYYASTAMNYDDTSFFDLFDNKDVPAADPASDWQTVWKGAGNTL